jgi:SAM-dependent methyltransferase
MEERLAEIRRRFGPWTAHNIELPGGAFTIGPNSPTADSERGNYFVEIACTALRREARSLSVLDLGCLEGGIAIQFARAGATVDGIDVREASIAKAEAVRDILELTKLRFLVGDALALTETRLLSQTYDVVICAGLLYHIDAPALLPFLRDIAGRCTGLVLIDTHVAIAGEQRYATSEGLVLHGKVIAEQPPHATTDRRGALWASWNSDYSFWMSEHSLQNALYLAGFSLVARVGQPFYPWPWKDRQTWIAYPPAPLLKTHYRSRAIPEPDDRDLQHPSARFGFNC